MNYKKTYCETLIYNLHTRGHIIKLYYYVLRVVTILFGYSFVFSIISYILMYQHITCYYILNRYYTFSTILRNSLIF